MNDIEKLRIYFNMPNATDDEIFNRYIGLSYDDMVKCQIKGLGRSLHLVAKDVNTQEECDMYNFFLDTGGMLYILEEWQDRYTDDLEEDDFWHEYGDIYIFMLQMRRLKPL